MYVVWIKTKYLPSLVVYSIKLFFAYHRKPASDFNRNHTCVYYSPRGISIFSLRYEQDNFIFVIFIHDAAVSSVDVIIPLWRSDPRKVEIGPVTGRWSDLQLNFGGKFTALVFQGDGGFLCLGLNLCPWANKVGRIDASTEYSEI